MRFIALSLLVATSALAAPADEAATCTARHAALAKQAATFNGDARIKRLIDADLKRALREQAEGDGDECIEALDRACCSITGRNEDFQHIALADSSCTLHIVPICSGL